MRYKEREHQLVEAARFLPRDPQQVYQFIAKYGGKTRVMSGPTSSFYLIDYNGESVVSHGAWVVVNRRNMRELTVMTNKEFHAEYESILVP